MADSAAPPPAVPPAPASSAAPVFPDDGRHRIAVLAVPGVIPFELSIPARLFGTARDAAGRRLYTVATCGVEPGGGQVRTSADFAVVVGHGPEALAEADTVVVAATDHCPELLEHGVADPAWLAALDRIRPGARVVSICTGAFLLAAAGRLDGRRATTHWMHTDAFRRLFPRVALDPDVLFTDDGDVLTSAGVAAGVDLCLHLLRRDHGSGVANAVARRSVVPPWRDGGQAQFVDRPVPEPRGASTASAREWALAHLDAPLPLGELARRTGMSVRTFTRRFRAETGLSPGEWLLRQRLALARGLLERAEPSVEQVAREAGFGTAASLRAHMNAVLGVGPAAYRRTFAAPPDPAGPTLDLCSVLD